MVFTISEAIDKIKGCYNWYKTVVSNNERARYCTEVAKIAAVTLETLEEVRRRPFLCSRPPADFLHRLQDMTIKKMKTGPVQNALELLMSSIDQLNALIVKLSDKSLLKRSLNCLSCDVRTPRDTRTADTRIAISKLLHLRRSTCAGHQLRV
jgi:hypothetical protein